MTDSIRVAAEQARVALEEALTYIESPSWSPSMASEVRAALASLEAALQARPEPVAASPAAAEGVPTNQCDGCARGLPVANGIHRGPGSWDVQSCTADRYASPVAPAGAPTRLTDEQIRDLATPYYPDSIQFARRIEAALLSAQGCELATAAIKQLRENSVHPAAPSGDVPTAAPLLSSRETDRSELPREPL